MPRFEPFPGLRYRTGEDGAVDDVSCPPFDVITPALREQLLARSPYNMVRLEIPEGLGPEGTGDAAPLAARANLDAWRAEGILQRDHTPTFYGYRTTAAGDAERPAQCTVGVIGALWLEPPGTGILPHEATTGGARTGHSRLLAALRTNVSAIWALTPTTGLADLATPPPPANGAAPKVLAHATDEDGVLHELWAITDPDRVAAIAALVGSEPLVLADGHHRFETALAYQAARQASGHTDDTGAGALMAYVVELSEEQLHVQGIHRLLTGVPRSEQLLQALTPHFELTPTGPVDATITARMDGAGALAVVTRDGVWLARPRAAAAAPTDDLDSRRLDAALQALPEAAVRYQHGWAQVAAAVAGGQADAAVLLRPPTVRQIADISLSGIRMPPKTTFFWPKPRTGLVLRELDA